MMPKQISPVQGEARNTLQDRIDRLNQTKIHLFNEWDQAMKRAYHVPASHRHNVLQIVGKRYSELIDTIETHVTILKSSGGEFPSRIEHLLLRTDRL